MVFLIPLLFFLGIMKKKITSLIFENIKKVIDPMFGNEREKNFILYSIASILRNDFNNDKLFIMKGAGSNGMSLLLSLTFDKLVTSLPSSFFSKSDLNDSSSYLYGLRNARAAFITEAEESHFKSGVIKRICGGDMMTVRNPISNDFINFRLRTKFFISMNNTPTFSTLDYSTRRRIEILPFDTKFVEEPKDVIEKKSERNHNLYNEFFNYLVSFLKKGRKQLLVKIKDLSNANSLLTFLKLKLKVDSLAFVTPNEIIKNYY